MSIQTAITLAESEALDQAALEWSRSNRATNFQHTPLYRFAGIVSFAPLDNHGFRASQEREVVVHLEAENADEAKAKLKALVPILAPDLNSWESGVADIYNVYREEENPGFVLRGVIASGASGERIDDKAVWLFSCGLWPGFFEQIKSEAFRKAA